MNALIYIIVYLLLMAVVVVILYFSRSLIKTKDGEADELSVEKQKRIIGFSLKELNCNCKWTIKEDSQIAEYEYQNGLFRILLRDHSPFLELSYLFFHETELDNLEMVRNICNQCNVGGKVPRVVYTINQEKGAIYIHQIAVMPIQESHETDLLKECMKDMFQLRNFYHLRFDELYRNSIRIEQRDFEKDNAKWNRELFLVREQELMGQKKGGACRQEPFQMMSLSFFLSTLLSVPDLVFKRLTIIKDGQSTIYDSSEEIGAFPFASPLFQENSFAADMVMLVVAFEDGKRKDKERIATIHLKPENSTEHTLYFRVTTTLVPLSSQPMIPLGSDETHALSVSMLMAFDMDSSKQRLDEFHYMWKEAREIFRRGDESSLTAEQKLICHCTDAKVGFNLYYGQVLVEQKRFMESVQLLENAFTEMSKDILAKGKDAREDFFKVCYLLGFSYTELGLYKQANYYLEMLLPLHRISFTKVYVNCLVNSHDFRAMEFIDGLLLLLDRTNNGEEGVEMGEEEKDFLDFLKRRKVSVLVNQNHFSEAREILWSMLEEPANNDFAVKMLAKMQRSKNED